MKTMIRRLLILLPFIAILLTACAWENPPEDGAELNRIWEVRMVMEGSFNSNVYYIIAFNFSGNIDQKPLAVLEGIDRCKYWDVYYIYGKPGDRPDIATKPLGFYKGVGGIYTGGELPTKTDSKKRLDDPTKPPTDDNPLDILPEPLENQLEYLDARITSSPIEEGGAVVPNNTIYLKFNWKGFPQFPNYINMNMMITNLGVDTLSNDPGDDLKVEFWDSFANNGVSLPIYQNDEFLEKDFLVEVPAADQIVPGRTPALNIVDWSVRILN
jgi:hypothetical protein